MANLSTSGSAPGFREYAVYTLDIMPSQSLHQLIFNEAVVAASNRALIVREHDLREIVYIPRDDIIVPLTCEDGQSSYCPFKGVASYWRFSVNGSTCEMAAWSYENPFEEVSLLKGYIAFYTDKMDCHWRNGIEQPLLGPGRQNGEECCAMVAA